MMDQDPPDVGIPVPSKPRQPEESRYARLKAGLDHGRSKATETSERLQAARGRSDDVDTAYQAIDRDVMSGGGLMAGALAFRLFLVLLPLTLVFVSLLGLLSHLGIVSPDALSDSFGLTGLVAKTIGSSGDTSAWGDFVTLCITVPTVLYFLWQLAARPQSHPPHGLGDAPRASPHLRPHRRLGLRGDARLGRDRRRDELASRELRPRGACRRLRLSSWRRSSSGCSRAGFCPTRACPSRRWPPEP